MARLARAVAAGVPHHVTQRGNRRQPTFFEEADYELYRALLSTACRLHRVEVWAYCLMPNHVHLILAPATSDGLRLALSGAHQRYTRAVNQRHGWVGHLWQGRFASCALDNAHLLAAARYVELNPVRAKLVERPEDWPWSSARAHLSGRSDGLVAESPLREEVGDWSTFLSVTPNADDLDELRRHTRTGRPLGEAGFVTDVELQLGRCLRPGRRGRRRATPTGKE